MLSIVRQHLLKIQMIIGIIVLVIAGMLLFRAYVMSPPQETNEFKFQELNQQWFYRWGDIGSDSAQAPATLKEWHPLSFPYYPPGRGQNKILLVRTTIPKNNFKSPALKIRLVLEQFEVYLDGTMIYRFGNPSEVKPLRSFQGWPWHIISLPDNCSGKTLLFRIASEHIKMGIEGRVFLADRETHIVNILISQTDKFVLGFIFIFMGFFILFIYIQDRANDPEIGYFSFGTFAISMGVFTISKAGSDVKQLFLHAPLLWSYLEISSLYMAPIALIAYSERILGRKKILAVLWISHLFYAVIALVAVAAGLIHLSKTIVPFQVLLLFSMLSTSIIIIIEALKGNRSARYFIIGILLICILNAIDVFVAMGILYTTYTFSQWGIFVFLILISLQMGNRYKNLTAQISQSYKELEENHKALIQYQNNLENLVIEKTRELRNSLEELAELNGRLEELSQIDGLTGLHNRRFLDQSLSTEWRRAVREKHPISIVMMDVDNFKNYNDTYGHLEGDKVLINIAKKIRKHTRRATDIAARYGGEEFCVVLPNTDIDGAVHIAEKIRHAIFSHKANLKKRATISIGVATAIPSRKSTPRALIAQADEMLYRAKHAGKNCVKANILPKK